MGVVATTIFFSCNQSDEFIPDVEEVQIAQEDGLYVCLPLDLKRTRKSLQNSSDSTTFADVKF